MPDEELPEELRRVVHHLRRSVEVDPEARARVLAAVRSDRAARAAAARRARFRFTAGLAAVAAAGLLVIVTGRRSGTESSGGGRETPAHATPPVASRRAAAGEAEARGAPRVHRIAVRLPPAERVHLVGDFNGWDRAATPMRFDAARGRWVADVVLPPGRYAYALVVDDSLWVPDPDAARTPPDELGVGRSILVIDSLPY